MRYVIAVCAPLALAGFAAPPAHAATAPTVEPLSALMQISDDQTTYVKSGWKGGKGWNRGRAWGHYRARRGPPPWAPAYGYRRKHRW
jgi:hypothetical protein